MSWLVRAVAGIRRLAVVAWAWLHLRRRPPLARLASIGHPERFCRAMVLPAGRHLGLALHFLPRPLAGEAGVAFELARALDAFEDLSPDPSAARAGVAGAVAFLTGEARHPPSTDRLRATRDSDRVELLLAARLPLLRAAVDSQPAATARRLRDVTRRIGAGMIASLADARPDPAGRRRYADRVLGEAVLYAAHLAAPGTIPPRAACLATARVLQAANDLRDVDVDHQRADTGDGGASDRAAILLRALPDLPLAPALLRWLGDHGGAGVRACAALMATSTCRFFLRQVGLPVPAALRPLRAAFGAARSLRRYRATVDAVGDALRTALLRLGAPATGEVAAAAPAAPARLTPARARPLADVHPDPDAADALAVATAQLDLAAELLHTLPEAPLTGALPAEAGNAVLVADHLLFSAVDGLSALGPDAVADVAALLERLAAHPTLSELAAADDVTGFVRARQPVATPAEVAP